MQPETTGKRSIGKFFGVSRVTGEQLVSYPKIPNGMRPKNISYVATLGVYCVLAVDKSYTEKCVNDT